MLAGLKNIWQYTVNKSTFTMQCSSVNIRSRDRYLNRTQETNLRCIIRKKIGFGLTKFVQVKEINK